MIPIVILASGNGSNMENLVLKLHNKTLSKALKEHGFLFKTIDKVGQEALKKLPQSDKKIQVVALICNKKEAFALDRAKRLGIPSFVIESKGRQREEFEGLLYDKLSEIYRQYGKPYIALAGFMRILSKSFFEREITFPIINIHPSFLPLHKGANGIRDSFLDSNDFGGVSIHFVNEELDSGAIIMQEKLAKIPNESLESFETRIHELEYKLYPKGILMALIQA